MNQEKIVIKLKARNWKEPIENEKQNADIAYHREQLAKTFPFKKKGFRKHVR